MISKPLHKHHTVFVPFHLGQISQQLLKRDWFTKDDQANLLTLVSDVFHQSVEIGRVGHKIHHDLSRFRKSIVCHLSALHLGQLIWYLLYSGHSQKMINHKYNCRISEIWYSRSMHGPYSVGVNEIHMCAQTLNQQPYEQAIWRTANITMARYLV